MLKAPLLEFLGPLADRDAEVLRELRARFQTEPCLEREVGNILAVTKEELKVHFGRVIGVDRCHVGHGVQNLVLRVIEVVLLFPRLASNPCEEKGNLALGAGMLRFFGGTRATRARSVHDGDGRGGWLNEGLIALEPRKFLHVLR